MSPAKQSLPFLRKGKFLTLLLLMIGTFFLISQYRQRVSSSSGKVSVVTLDTSGTSDLVAPIKLDRSPIDNLLYPNGQVKSKDTDSVLIESRDSTNTITNWYKEKLNSLGYGSTSFVVTNSNDNILNTLVVTKDGEEVRIEIIKSAASTKTTINIELK